MIEDKFWELATKYMSNEASEEDINELFLLLKSDEKYQKAFSDTVEKWNGVTSPRDFQFNTKASKQKLLEEIDKRSSPISKIRAFSKSSNFRLKAAAMVVVLLGTYFLTNSILEGREWKEFQTVTNEKLKIILPDSTHVWLNQNSSISYNYSNPEERLLKLEGEAFFDVARNESRPFLIEGPYFKTQVLGTSFNIHSRNEEDASVSVVSGKVSVSANESNALLLLERGDGAIFRQGDKSLSKRKLNDVDNEMAWIEGRFVFENSTMKSVLNYLSKYYKVTFDLSNENLNNCLITASFKGESLNNILTILCASLDCKYEIVANRTIILSGNGCQKKPGDITSIVPAKNQ
ncbi:FecR family protein [Zobellia alginiliquefaciens]|uniref:FecR family protein n=1 Tax=Zobellia alginiliquefaciens TaxID=3032586 RepID=UPI0023E339B2|nr:FecR family protein [Zobellia alginiliquefaciens]